MESKVRVRDYLRRGEIGVGLVQEAWEYFLFSLLLHSSLSYILQFHHYLFNNWGSCLPASHSLLFLTPPLFID